jgi:hypothetical protein
MRIVILTAVLILLIPASVRGEEIATNPKDFFVFDDGGSVVLQGTWRRTSQRPTIEVPQVNSVRIECYRAARICNEYAAKFIQKSDDPLGAVDRPRLYMMKEQFRVIEWTGTTITARAEPRAADIYLRISLIDRTAERSSRETATRGAQGANPQNVTQWVLR